MRLDQNTPNTYWRTLYELFLKTYGGGMFAPSFTIFRKTGLEIADSLRREGYVISVTRVEEIPNPLLPP